jgi:glycosyltransferase involved in cell wall biosynthesis
MYWGLPVVATAVNGAKELVVDEETGLAVPPQDPPAMARAIDRLISDPNLAKRLGANAQRKAKELMDGQQMISAIEDVYAKLA